MAKEFNKKIVFLLEGAIQGALFRFTDDKAERHAINEHLSKTAGSIVSLLKEAHREAWGRKKKELDGRVKRIHVFDSQLKSTKELQTEALILKLEVQQWRNKIHRHWSGQETSVQRNEQDH